MTVARVAEVTVTDCTVADTAAANRVDDICVMIGAYCGPSSSRLTFVATLVFPLKNVSQLFSTFATAADGPPGNASDGPPELELGWPLEQAADTAPSTRPSTGTGRYRQTAIRDSVVNLTDLLRKLVPDGTGTGLLPDAGLTTGLLSAKDADRSLILAD